jgi:hypothetical protein
MQELEIEPGADAWSNFEAYVDQTHHAKNDGNRLNMQVPISMNVVLPLVFGAVIILIAVLLYRFISIKNPPPTEPPAIEADMPVKRDSVPPTPPLKKTAVNADSLARAKALAAAATLSATADSLKTAATTSETVDAKPKADKQDKNLSNGDTGITQRTDEKPRVKESALFPPEEGTKTKKKRQKKNTADNAEAEKPAEELPPSGDETEASMKPNSP